MKVCGRQRGLSLIELMIGLLLSSLLLLGVLQVFDGNRRTHSLQESFSRIQESGRIATDWLARDLRGAAFSGCVVDSAMLTNYVGAPFNANYVGGTDNATGQIIGGEVVEESTDILSIRGADDACGGRGRIAANAGANAVHIAGNCNQLQVGDVVMVANCRAGDITTVTAISSAPATVTVNDNFGVPYGAEAMIYAPFVRTYFISRKEIADMPGLYVSENGAAATELVPGVENLQVLYGRDTAGDGIVDIWGNPPASSAESDQVVAIQIQLLVASGKSDGAKPFSYTPLGKKSTVTLADDGRLRKEYAVTNKLRNRGRH